MVLERREMTESRLQSIGRSKMVLTVTSDPRAKERVMAEPEVSTYSIIVDDSC